MHAVMSNPTQTCQRSVKCIGPAEAPDDVHKAAKDPEGK